MHVGDIATADDGDLVMKISNTKVDFYKDIYLNGVLFTGGGGGTFHEHVIIHDPFELQYF